MHVIPSVGNSGTWSNISESEDTIVSLDSFCLFVYTFIYLRSEENCRLGNCAVLSGTWRYSEDGNSRHL